MMLIQKNELCRDVTSDIPLRVCLKTLFINVRLYIE